VVPVEFPGPAYAAEVRLPRRLQMLGDLGQSGLQVADVPDQAIRFAVVVPPPRLGGTADQFVQLQLDTQGVISGPHQLPGTRFRHPPTPPAKAPSGAVTDTPRRQEPWRSAPAGSGLHPGRVGWTRVIPILSGVAC
jgi:hypothetical protein